MQCAKSWLRCLARMWPELRAVFDHLSHDPSTRVVVLSGAGPKAFTTGLDVVAASQGILLPSNSSSSSSPESKDGARMATKFRRHIDDFQYCISAIERCEKPVVAALHGYTFGLGVDIAVCADVRICAADTQFSVKEVDIGIAADIGTLSRLGKVVGNGSWIKDVCLSGRTFGAEEASRVGLVSWVAKEGSVGGKDAVIKEALRWAAIVAEKSPVAVQGTKELLNWSRDHGVQDGELFEPFITIVHIPPKGKPAMCDMLTKIPISRPALHQYLEQRHASDGRRQYCHDRRHPQDETPL